MKTKGMTAETAKRAAQLLRYERRSVEAREFGTYFNGHTQNALVRRGIAEHQYGAGIRATAEWIAFNVEAAHAEAVAIDPFTSEADVKARVAALRFAIEHSPSTVTAAQRAEVERADARFADVVLAAPNVVAYVPGVSLDAVATAMGLDLAADEPVGTLGITDAWTAALVERCARLGHRHVPARHPRPEREAEAAVLGCYFRNFAGLRVLVEEDDGRWVPAVVDTMMYRGDGFVVRADWMPDASMRARFNRLRLAPVEVDAYAARIAADNVAAGRLPNGYDPANADMDRVRRSAYALGFRADGNDLPNPCRCTGFSHVAPCPAAKAKAKAKAVVVRDDIDADKARNRAMHGALTAAGVESSLWMFHCVVVTPRGALFVGETYANLQGDTVKAVDFTGMTVERAAGAVRAWIDAA